MLFQVFSVAEALPAGQAAVGFLLCVDSLVPIKVRPAGEALPTDQTFVGSVSCVTPLVGF